MNGVYTKKEFKKRFEEIYAFELKAKSAPEK
jgi:hypothetical protein